MTPIRPRPEHGTTRRTLLAGAGLLPLAALAACSGGSSSSDDSSGSAASDGGSSASGSSDTRTVTDALGNKVEVPSEPKRVAVLHYAGVEAAVDLGVVPVGMGPAGSAGAEAEDVVPPELWAQIKDVPLVMDGSEVNLEKIAEVEPDLILAHNPLEEDVLKNLAEIAPVYVWTLRGEERANWQLRVDEIADALNRDKQLTELKDTWDKELKEVAEKHKDITSGLVTGVFSSYDEGNFYAWGEKNMVGTVLMPLGLTYSAQENAAVANESEPEADVSIEKIGETLGDVQILFYDSDLNDGTNTFLTTVMQSPLYQQLPAVAAGHAYPFFKNTIAGYSDARESLKKVDAALTAYAG